MFVARAQALWIPFTLMLTWSFYGLLRKQIAIGPIVGLGVEATLVLPLAAGYIAFAHAGLGEVVPARAYPLLIAAGIITATPLMLFAFAARRLRMTTIGLMQYIGPSVQFAMAIFTLNESVSRSQLCAFAFIWIGLIVFSVDSFRASRPAR
jgi:chloramphenicol-sensitive protein RarD